MTILDATQPALHIVPDTTADDNLTGMRPDSDKQLSMWQWLPLAALAAALTTCVLFASPNAPDQELNLLSRLAHEGDADAQLQLGLAYRDGRYELTPDAVTGMYWLRKAAAGGNAYAEDAVGNAFATGVGTARDIAKAETWWRKSMQDGDREARLHLADALVQTGRIDEANRLFGAYR
jgi:TPR repeat protein